MKTSDTCKWWMTNEHQTDYGRGFRIKEIYGYCDSEKVNGQTDEMLKMPNGKHRGYGTHVVPNECSGESTEEHLNEGWIEREDKHTIPLDEAIPRASDEHGLVFCTGPKFGCIHHEPK